MELHNSSLKNFSKLEEGTFTIVTDFATLIRQLTENEVSFSFSPGVSRVYGRRNRKTV